LFAVFATSKEKKRIQKRNYVLILQPCSVEMFALNIQTSILQFYLANDNVFVLNISCIFFVLL